MTRACSSTRRRDRADASRGNIHHPGALQLYIGVDASASAVGIAVVRGGDSLRDATATAVVDAALRVTRERRAAHFNGVSAYSPLQSALSGALTALEMVARIDPASPVVLRFGSSAATAVAAGAGVPLMLAALPPPWSTALQSLAARGVATSGSQAMRLTALTHGASALARSLISRPATGTMVPCRRPSPSTPSP